MTDEMEIDRFIVSDIRIGKDRRPVDPKRLRALIKSIADIGLQTPITVWTAVPGGTHGAVHLVAGLHRLEAYKSLGLPLIEAFRTSGSELDRDLWQIDENLMRSDLTELGRADQTAKRAKIIKARKQLFAKLADNSKGGPKDAGQVEFVADTAALTGRSIRAVERDLHRGHKISNDIHTALVGMPAADIGVELDAIADLGPKDQPIALERVQSGASKNFREAKVFILGADDKARRKTVRKRIREHNTALTAKYEARREAMLVSTELVETLDEMGTYYEKERAELRRISLVAGHTPGQQRDHSQLGTLKTAWRSTSDPARAAFVEWAVEALRLGMRNRDAAGGTP